MNISPLDRLGLQADLSDIRADSRLIYLCIPVLVKTAFDEDTTSGNDSSSGQGLGEAPASWRLYAMRVHFRNVDTALMTFGHVPPGVELGDALVNFGLRDLAMVQIAQADPNHYVEIDGDTFAIVSILPSGLGQIEEWSFDARHYTPIFTAPGH